AQVGSLQKLWRAADFCCLIKTVGQLNQRRFAISRSEERYAKGQSVRVARRHGDVRITRNCRGRRIAPGKMVTVDPISRPRRSASRRDERVKLVPTQHEVDPFIAR